VNNYLELEEIRLVVFNATFNNTSVILLRSVLLVEEPTGLPGENHRLELRVVFLLKVILLEMPIIC